MSDRTLPSRRDVIVAGAGPVGATVALLLARTSERVAIVAPAPNAKTDPRALALSYGSRLILERAAVWDSLSPTPIDTIHVSQQGGFGRTLLSAGELGVAALGYVLPYAELSAVLLGALAASGVETIEGTARVANEQDDPEWAALAVSARGTTSILQARLAIIAAGDAAGAPRAIVRHYEQRAIVTSLRCSRPRPGWAWERFTGQGPLALLPRGGHDYELIWSTSTARSEALMALSDRAFEALLEREFGHRLGRLELRDARHTYALALGMRREIVGARTVFLGNAAQTFHPVAGQGLNVGLRDAFELAESLIDSPREEWGTRALLSRYANARRADRWGSAAMTDSLVRAFSNDCAPLSLLRGAGLGALDAIAPLRRGFARRMTLGRVTPAG